MPQFTFSPIKKVSITKDNAGPFSSRTCVIEFENGARYIFSGVDQVMVHGNPQEIKTDAPTLAIGDVVTLPSELLNGEPVHMTVDSVKEGIAHCVWFGQDGVPHRHNFHTKALAKVMNPPVAKAEAVEASMKAPSADPICERVRIPLTYPFRFVESPYINRDKIFFYDPSQVNF